MFDRFLEPYRWAWCVVSGVLLVACFAPFAYPTAGWIALVPAWWLLSRSAEVRRKPMRYGYLVGLIYFGGVFWWISNVTAVGIFFLVLYLALYPAVWFLLVARLVLRREGGNPTNGQVIFQALAAASLWVALEWWRSWFLTGFNWNELGISQAPSVIYRQLAAFGGVHLISFVLVTVNVLWAEGVLGILRTLQEKRIVRASFAFGAALVIVAICFALGWQQLHRYGIRKPMTEVSFACVQPNVAQIPYDGSSPESFQKREDEALEGMLKLTLLATAAKPDLLVWPEAIIDQGVMQDRPMNEAMQEICQSFGGYFLLGSSDFDLHTRKLYNSAYIFTPGGEEFRSYRKTKLVILGEFLPFAQEFPWVRKMIGMGMDFTPGDGPSRFVLKKPGGDYSLAPLICFEDTLPQVADKAARLDPGFFVTITNDGWYTGWCAAWGIRQHLNHAIFRCIEHDRPMLRCSNTGISCVIDPNGTVTSRYTDTAGREIDVGGIFRGKLDLYPPQKTLYEAWGDWIVLISSVVSVMLGLRHFCRLFFP